MIKTILSDILATASPSGCEIEITRKFALFMQPLVDEMTIDALDNVIAHKKGNGQRVMVVAHSDEVAMMVTYIDNDGFVYFQEVGAIDTNILPEQMVEIHHNGKIEYGIIGKKPLHLQNKSEYAKDWNAEELWIDLGVKNKSEAEKLVSVGDYVTFKIQPTMLQNGMIASKSLDDKSGIATLMATAQELQGKTIDNDLYFVASVQEELGARGAKVVAQVIKPDIAIAVDTTHATDYPSVSPQRNGEIRLGNGVVITKSPNVDNILVEELINITKENDIKYQIQAISHQTGSDINPIQLIESGVRTALISIPVRYMHTPNEVASIEDIECAVRLIEKFCMRKH